MGKDQTKGNENIYFQARKRAATYDDRLRSRESAADLIGVSVSSLADYELGNTKVVPVTSKRFSEAIQRGKRLHFSK